MTFPQNVFEHWVTQKWMITGVYYDQVIVMVDHHVKVNQHFFKTPNNQKSYHPPVHRSSSFMIRFYTFLSIWFWNKNCCIQFCRLTWIVEGTFILNVVSRLNLCRDFFFFFESFWIFIFLWEFYKSWKVLKMQCCRFGDSPALLSKYKADGKKLRES